MKITKLMLAACAAVLALVSCNKDNTTPESSGNLKSVTLSLDNVSFETKGANDFVNPRLDNTEVKLGSIQFFFSDVPTMNPRQKSECISSGVQMRWE